MTSPQDQPRLMLPGAAGAAPSPRSRPPAPGLLRRGGSYILNSMRTQPILTLAAALLCVAVGISHLWATQPYWVVQPEYRIGSLAGDPAAPQLRVDVEPDELRHLLVSEPIVREVRQALQSEALDAGASPVNTGAVRRAAVNSWRAVRAIPGALAASLGLGREGDEPLADSLHVNALPIAERDRVVKLDIRAVSAAIAERAPELLLDRVRQLLLEQERSRTLARVEELRPARETAALKSREASSAVAQYRLEIGRHDPEVSAQEIQSRLVRTRGDRADLETDLREAEANRLDITGKLQSAVVEQTTRVVVEQNARIQQLQTEISTLESRYAADLAVKTAKHQDMVRLRLEIESRKRDLNNEELLVIREKVQEPSMEYVGLLERQAQNNRQLVTLAGRELGLAETEALLQTQLVEAMKTAQHMADLIADRTAAETALARIDSELGQLEARLTSIVPFSQITLVGRVKVADPAAPDEPNATLHLIVTAVAAALLAMILPTLRSLVRSRLIAPWQVEQMAGVLPVQLIGELPGPAQRLLARLPGGEGR